MTIEEIKKRFPLIKEGTGLLTFIQKSEEYIHRSHVRTMDEARAWIEGYMDGVSESISNRIDEFQMTHSLDNNGYWKLDTEDEG